MNFDQFVQKDSKHRPGKMLVYWCDAPQEEKYEELGRVPEGFDLVSYVTFVHDNPHYKIEKLEEHKDQLVSISDSRNGRCVAEYIVVSDR